MFKYQQLIKENLSEVAKLITVEQGKTHQDAEGDVMRGLQVGQFPSHSFTLHPMQVVEQLCANTTMMMGETLTGISKDMDLTSHRSGSLRLLHRYFIEDSASGSVMTFAPSRVPLGVCAGIAPFNFPAMIPLWMFPTGEESSPSSLACPRFAWKRPILDFCLPISLSF